MEPDVTPILPQDTFCFSCTPDVPCFNECCRDLNQFLTPYDILRLKRHLGLSSAQFLAQYTSRHIGPETGLPVVTLKPMALQGLVCPFVTPKGCSVYENRPSSCRTYPLMRAVAQSRETGEMTERFMLLKEPHCRGFKKGKAQTVQQWIDEQEIADYNRINDKLMHIISLKNRLIPGPLDIKSGHIFNTALYDLDNFRTQIVNTGLLNDFPVRTGMIDAALEDDVVLLELGMKWVQHVLFSQ